MGASPPSSGRVQRPAADRPRGSSGHYPRADRRTKLPPDPDPAPRRPHEPEHALREQFALAALTGLMAATFAPVREWTGPQREAIIAATAEHAYTLADAALAARVPLPAGPR